MRVDRIITNIKTLGPGNRLCIWTNGCYKRCKGCVSPNLQLINIKTEINVIDSVSKFNLSKVDGITISGGEPFIQAYELFELVKFLKSKGFEDILVYSGYKIEELKNKNDENIDYILENIGVLIDGEYIQDLNDDECILRGSTNQRIIFINEKLKDKYNEYLKKSKRSMQEFNIGNMKIGVGIPTQDYIKNF